MTDNTFEAGLDKGAELAAQKFAEQSAELRAEQEAARLAEVDAAWGLDPRKQAYMRDNFGGGDMSIDDWNTLNEFLRDNDIEATEEG